MENKFYILNFDFPSRKYWHFLPEFPKDEESARQNYFDYWTLEVCQPLNIEREFRFETRVKGEKAKFNLLNGEIPVVSKDVLGALSSYLKNAEFFPVVIDGEKTDYNIVNILNEVDCIDRKSSSVKIVKDPKDITAKRKMVVGGSASFKFDNDKEYPDIFRVKYGYQIIGVSQIVKETLESIGLKELIFIPFEDEY